GSGRGPEPARPRRPRAARRQRLRHAVHPCRRHERAVDHDRRPRRSIDSWLTTGDLMTGNPDTPLTIDTHHHILPDFFWRETNVSHVPVGGLAPLEWSKEA